MAGTPQQPPDDFVALFEQHHPRALRLAYLLSRDRAASEDVAAAAMARVFERWRRGGIDDVWRYLATVVVNEVRRRGRRAALEQRALTLAPRATAGEDTDGATVDRDLLRRLLAELSQRQREVLVLRYYADMSEADIAATLGCSPGSVKTHASRGLARLRAAMPRDEVDA